jgi:predicted DCC family thiol-disulfide oxidoreductase YuxK
MNHSLQQPVVLYDGQCNFCRSQIELLKRLGGQNRLRFLSLHDPSVAKKYPDLTSEQLMEQMWIIAPNEKRYGGAWAVRYLTRVLPILWPLAPILHVPGLMGVWQYLYRQIAKRRYLIAGRQCEEGGTCHLHYSDPTPQNKSTH